MRILALTKYGDLAASTRQRLLLYAPLLASSDVTVDVRPLLNNDYLHAFNRGERTPLASVLGGYLGRTAALLRSGHYDAIWVYMELFPYLPALFERSAALAGLPIIFDFDDAVFHQYGQHRSPIVRSLLARKHEPLLRRAAVCFCGNGYLRAWAAQHSRNAHTIPTVVDTAQLLPATVVGQPARQPGGQPPGLPVIGWMGSPSTGQYLDPVLPALRNLAEQALATSAIVGARRSESVAGIEYRDWSLEHEVKDLQGMDVGLMPLPDMPWTRGKCGYKLIQYMAAGIPVIASPVGVNTELVEHGVNGFLAETDEEWNIALRTLVQDRALRRQMGEAGRRKAVECYSLEAVGPRVLDLTLSVLHSDQR